MRNSDCINMNMYKFLKLIMICLSLYRYIYFISKRTQPGKSWKNLLSVIQIVYVNLRIINMQHAKDFYSYH